MSNDTPLRILIVHNYYRIPGGEDSVVANEIELLKEHGHQVYTYFRNNDELSTLSKPEKLLFPLHAIYSSKTFREVQNLLREHSIDIVHVHNTLTMISPAVYYAAKTEGIPVVQTIHNFRLICPGATLYRRGQVCEDCLKKGLSCSLKHHCYRNSLPQTFIAASILAYHRHRGIYRDLHYICLTDFNRQKLLEVNTAHKILFPEDQISVKPNFIANTKTSAPFTASYLSRPKNLLFIGRMDETKGIKELLSCWERLEATGTDYTLTLCGSGDLSEWVMNYLKEHPLKQVYFLGQIPNKQVKELLANSRALLFPTRWYEGFPVTIVESFAAGTPVIGSDIGNVAQVVLPGENGLLFPAQNMDALYQLLLHLDEQDMAHLSEGAYNDYCKHYTAEQNYAQLYKIYQKALSRSKRKLGIIALSLNRSAQKGFYNSQQIGLGRALAKAGNQVTVYQLVPKDYSGPLKEQPLTNLTIQNIRAASLGFNGFFPLKELDSHLDSLLCFSDTQLYTPWIARFCRKHGISIHYYVGIIQSTSVHALFRKIMDFSSRKTLRLYQKAHVFVKTPACLEQLQKKGCQDLTLAPVCLDAELLNANFSKVDREKLCEKWNLPVHQELFLFLGRLVPEKEPLEMISLFSIIHEKKPDTHLIMIGKGLLENDCESLIQKLHLEHDITRYSSIPNADIWEFYRMASCFCNLNRHEIFGMSILEAMYYECPVIAMHAPGPDFIIQHQKTGFLCDGDAEFLSTIEKQQYRQISLRTAAHEHIVNDFLWDSKIETYCTTLLK